MAQQATRDDDSINLEKVAATRMRNLLDDYAQEWTFDIDNISVKQDPAHRWITVYLESENDPSEIYELSEQKADLITEIMQSSASVALRSTCDGEAKLHFSALDQ
jgi:hypothetical protein